MHQNLAYKNIITKTLELFPEYKNSEHYTNNDQELQYSFFFGFTNYVIEKILNSQNPENDPEIKKYFDLFNQIIESTDNKLSELGAVEILETLVQDKKSKIITEKMLNDEGKKQLIHVLKYTGVK
jgi:hypothetical protein